MDPADLARELAAIDGRGACTDAERRAARLLSRELRERGRTPRTETVWVRPGWPGVWLVYGLLGIAGSVVSVDHSVVGLAILVPTALAALVDASGRNRALSALLPKRATQNVIAEGAPPRPQHLWGVEEEAAGAQDGPRVRLVIAAGYDAARVTPPTTRAVGRAYLALGRRFPSPAALLALFLVALAGLAGARVAGEDSTVLGAVQLVPTVGCILAVALLAELAFATPAAGANANASAAGAAFALLDALDRSAPHSLDVEIVLAGAAGAGGLGMRSYVKARRKRMRAEDVAVVHFEPSGTGSTVYWTVDGPLLPTRLHPELTRLAAAAAQSEQHLQAKPHRGRGATGAMQARRARWPAIAIGAVDGRGEAPPDPAEQPAGDGAVGLALLVVRGLDRRLAGR